MKQYQDLGAIDLSISDLRAAYYASRQNEMLVSLDDVDARLKGVHVQIPSSGDPKADQEAVDDAKAFVRTLIAHNQIKDFSPDGHGTYEIVTEGKVRFLRRVSLATT